MAIAKKESHLPVVVDPSQGCGRADLVKVLCRGAVAIGADALLIEVHPHPAEALSDGQQQVDFEVFSELISELQPFLNATSKNSSRERVSVISTSLSIDIDDSSFAHEPGV